MFDNETMFKEWISMLLKRNNITETKELTREMIEEEIEDTRAAINHEKLCALGSSTSEVAAMHSNNVERMFEYIERLKTVLPQLREDLWRTEA